MLTMAGVVGLGPGAALGQPPSTGHGSTASSDGAASRPTQPNATDSSRSTPEATGGDGWLTIDDSPAAGSTDGPGTAAGSATALPEESGTGKRVVYDISAQRVWLVGASDRVQRTYLVSGGKDVALLKPGSYQVTSMSRHAVAYNHKSTMNYMVRFASGRHAPIGFHDVPARSDGSLVQSRSELGTPLSSGCIRQWISDARAMWEFAKVDTPVVVTA